MQTNKLYRRNIKHKRVVQALGTFSKMFEKCVDRYSLFISLLLAHSLIIYHKQTQVGKGNMKIFQLYSYPVMPDAHFILLPSVFSFFKCHT